jgi:hypothetical protein
MFDKKVLFILFVSMVLAVIIAVLTDHEMDDEKSKALFIHKTHTREKYNLIIAGDSRIYRGVSAKIAGEILGMKAINLGYSSGGYGKEMFDLIDKLIDLSSDKKILILGITPLTITDLGSDNGHIKRVLDTKKETILEYEYLFSIKNFFAPTSPNRIRKNIKEKYYNKYHQEMYIEEGWIASWYNTPFPYLALKEYKKTFSETHISEIVIQNLYLKIKEWRNKGIEVYGFFVPSSVNMVELEKNLGKFKADEFFKGFIDSGGKWIDIEASYSSYDGSHLDKESAIRISKEIAQKVKQQNIIAEYQPGMKINSIYDITHYTLFKEFYSGSEQKLNPPFEGDRFEGSQKINLSLFKDHAVELINNKIKRVEIQISVQYNDAETESILGCTIKHKKVELNTDYSTIPNQWCKLFLSIEVPGDLTENDSISIYLNNPHKKVFHTDSLKIYYIAE